MTLVPESFAWEMMAKNQAEIVKAIDEEHQRAGREGVFEGDATESYLAGYLHGLGVASRIAKGETT